MFPVVFCLTSHTGLQIHVSTFEWIPRDNEARCITCCRLRGRHLDTTPAARRVLRYTPAAP